jgi:NADPH2:quinone reductase
MKTWQVHRYGEPEDMVLAEVATPSPAAGQVLIRNHAVGLNFFDILQIQGKYQSKPAFPFTVGAEIAGVVAATGAGVADFAVGDRVLAFCQAGAYAEYTIAPAAKTLRMPPVMDFHEAAAFPVVYQTSYFALNHRGRLAPQEWLLVHAGASGVGMSAIQLGKAAGARVIATAGSNEKLAFCRRQGADHAISYRDETWPERVKEITGRGADVIYDPVGGDVFDFSTKCIASDGRLLVVGFTSGRIPTVQANRVLLKNMSVVGVFWGRQIDEHPEYFSEANSALVALYTAGKIRPSVSQAYPLSDAPRALRDLAQRKVLGKAVLSLG